MKKLLCYCLLLIASILANAQQSVQLTITDTSGPIINKNIYGQFAEHLGRCVYDGMVRNGKVRMDVVDALKRIKLPLLRWPGGCFADNYHWKDGVGPLKKRAKTVNIMWGMVPEDNSFGTDEFLRMCELIGCEPYLAANVGTGSPQEMEDWIEYCNYAGTSTMADMRIANGRKMPYRVKYWGIGNESWGCGGRMTPMTYVDRYKTFANYCREYPGAPVFRIASGAQDDDYNWTDYLMCNISPRFMQGIGVHYYTDAGGRTDDYSTAFGEDLYFHSMKNALRMEEIVSRHSAIMDRWDPAKRVALIVDEWGIVVGDENSSSYFYQQNSLRDALVAASTLNIFNNHCDRVRMANLAQVVNVLQSLILTSGDSMLLTPTYHVFDLFKVHQNATSLVVNFSSPWYQYGNNRLPAVNVSASRDSSGLVHVTLVNIDPVNTISVQASIGAIAEKVVSAQILTSSKFTDVNTFSKNDLVKPVSFNGASVQSAQLNVQLPAKSVVMIELKSGS